MPLPDGTKAVNIACGTAVVPGRINIDNSPNARLARYPPFGGFCGKWACYLIATTV
jgi:hypothetical protein